MHQHVLSAHLVVQRIKAIVPGPRRPLDPWRVGSCITRFGTCTAFKFVTACRLAKSPERPSTPEAPAASFPLLLLRLLPGGAKQFPGGNCTRCGPTPFPAHAEVGLGLLSNEIGEERKCGGSGCTHSVGLMGRLRILAYLRSEVVRAGKAPVFQSLGQSDDWLRGVRTFLGHTSKAECRPVFRP